MMVGRLRTRAGSDESGLTLVELLVVVLLLGVVGAIGVTGLVRSMETSRYSQDRGDALQAAQVGLERMSREIRAADPLRTADAGFVTLDVRREDAGGNERLYHYRYEVTGPVDGQYALEEEVWRFDDPDVFDDPGFVPSEPAAQETRSSVLVPDLAEGAVFEFLDGNGNAGAPVELTRQVRIVLERTVSDGTEPIVVETIVKVRNA